MKLKITLALLAALAWTGLAHGQTPPSAGQYQIGAGYSSVGGPTDNGTLLTFAKQFGTRNWAQAKTFLLSHPSGVTIATVGPRYRFSWSAIKRPDGYFDTSRWYTFVDGNIGVVKDGTGAHKFAYGIGAGIDYQASPSVTLMVFEADYIRSKYFPTGGILVTNLHSVSSGLKFSF